MLKLRSLITALALAAALSPAAYAAYSDKTFTVTNSGNGPLTISGATVTGNTAEFALTGNTCTNVAAGGSCALTVRFSPSGSGTRTPASLNFTSNGTSGPTHSIALTGTGGSSCAAGKQIYAYTGADQVIQVPAGCTTATIKAWGAGGRGGNSINAPTAGGGGGFAQRTVSALAPNASLLVVVGQGASGVAATYGGGGAGLTGSSYSGGAGGGLSGVFLGSKSQANALAISGGGGGGFNAYAGAGGGSSGATGGPVYSIYNLTMYPAGGGTPSAGGVGGGGSGVYGAAGTPLQGGAATNYEGSGGGGGYWGGGGAVDQAGGGGSGYAPGGTLTAGSGCNVANSADSDYASGIGNGGCAANTSGQNGRVVIIWQ